MSRTDVQRTKKPAMLAAYAELGVITHAAAAAGIERSTHWRWMQDDPEYAAKFAEAHEQAVEKLEREALRRAADGWEEPVFHKGEVVGHVKKFSDTLLIFMLKAARPEKYRESPTVIDQRQQTINLPEGTTIEDLRSLRDGLRA